MKLNTRARKALLAAGVSALAAGLGTAASPAQAASLSLNYTCSYPLIGAQPLKVDIDAGIPATIPVNEPSGAFDITATATTGGNTWTGLNLVGAKTIEGAATAAAQVAAPGGLNLPVNVPITIGKTDVPATNQPLTLTATGQTPSLTFTQEGSGTITVGNLNLNMTARDASGTPINLPPVGTDSDGDPGTFDVACTPDAGQNQTLATFTVTGDGGGGTDNPPTAPGAPTASNVTDHSVSLTWAESTDDNGVAGYDIYDGDEQISTTSTNNVTIGGLDPDTSYTLTVKARDTKGQSSDASAPVTFRTLPTDGGGGGTVDYGYNLTGSSDLKTLTTGKVPLSGTIDATLQLATGDFTADLALNKTKASLTALWLLPVTADIQFVPVGQTTGSLKNGVLTSHSKLTIKLPTISLFGFIPIGGGDTCQTKTPSDINLTSTGGQFNPLQGGTLTGTYAISDLEGCGSLNGLVSPLTAGGGNTITLKLAPKA